MRPTRKLRWLSRPSLLWLILFLLLVHNLEEALSLPSLQPLDPDFIYSALRPLLAETTYAQFLMALLSVMVLPFLIAERDDLHRSGKGGIFLLLGYQAVVLLNVFSHIASALILGGYQLCAALGKIFPIIGVGGVMSGADAVNNQCGRRCSANLHRLDLQRGRNWSAKPRFRSKRVAGSKKMCASSYQNYSESLPVP